MIDSAVILGISSPAIDSQLREQRPRAMLPALGKPMVVRVMDRLYRAGIRRYKVIVGINEGPIASYINNKWMPDAHVEFILKSTQSLGFLMSQIARKADKPFLLLGYNSFTFTLTSDGRKKAQDIEVMQNKLRTAKMNKLEETKLNMWKKFVENL